MITLWSKFGPRARIWHLQQLLQSSSVDRRRQSSSPPDWPNGRPRWSPLWMSTTLPHPPPPHLVPLPPLLYQQEPRQARRSPLCPAATSRSSRTASPTKTLTSATAPTSPSSSTSATSPGPSRSRWDPCTCMQTQWRPPEKNYACCCKLIWKSTQFCSLNNRGQCLLVSQHLNDFTCIHINTSSLPETMIDMQRQWMLTDWIVQIIAECEENFANVRAVGLGIFAICRPLNATLWTTPRLQKINTSSSH